MESLANTITVNLEIINENRVATNLKIIKKKKQLPQLMHQIINEHNHC